MLLIIILCTINMQSHLGSDLLEEICTAVKEQAGTIQIMKKVPGGYARAQHLLPLVQQYVNATNNHAVGK